MLTRWCWMNTDSAVVNRNQRTVVNTAAVAESGERAPKPFKCVMDPGGQGNVGPAAILGTTGRAAVQVTG
eukprot:m.410120 g.410120  ORF g.410120 m.410120 type:complete len:70 (-) comp16806_c1_seq22:66-275(-)